MNAALTPQNQALLKRLLQTGRWNNASEVLRYGLHLVAKEVQCVDLTPYPPGPLRRALKRMGPAERAAEKRMGEASARHQPKDRP